MFRINEDKIKEFQRVRPYFLWASEASGVSSSKLYSTDSKNFTSSPQVDSISSWAMYWLKPAAVAPFGRMLPEGDARLFENEKS